MASNTTNKSREDYFGLVVQP